MQKKDLGPPKGKSKNQNPTNNNQNQKLQTPKSQNPSSSQAQKPQNPNFNQAQKLQPPNSNQSQNQNQKSHNPSSNQPQKSQNPLFNQTQKLHSPNSSQNQIPKPQNPLFNQTQKLQPQSSNQNQKSQNPSSNQNQKSQAPSSNPKSQNQKQNQKIQYQRPQGSKGKLLKNRIPKADLNIEEKQCRTFSSISGNQSRVSIKPSKDFKEVPSKDYQKLFIQKCQQCTQICDFNYSDKATLSSISIKSELLRQIASAFSISNFVRLLTPEIMGQFYAMIAVNIFRPTPHIPTLSPFFQDVYSDLSWPHISLCYDVLKSSLNTPLSEQIPDSFLFKLVGNSTYPDYRERVAVRDFLHSIYMKYNSIRNKTRNYIAGHFCLGRCSTELLEFFTSIVMGFSLPLNTEHISFFHQAILPLFSLESFSSFSSALTTCVIHYVEKENSLFPILIEYLISHWPKANLKKISLYLMVFEDILTDPSINSLIFTFPALKSSVLSIFQMFGKYCNDGCCDVANTVLDILINPELASVIRFYAHDIFSILIPTLIKGRKKHWDESVRENAEIAIQALYAIDSDIFNDIAAQMKDKKPKKANDFLNKWTTVMELARQSDRSLKQVNINFSVL